MTLKERALKLHEENLGKIAITSKVKVDNLEDLSLAYSPGVAEPCKEIEKNLSDVYKYTSKGNMVAVITDASAVLGLGDMLPESSLPVMEGKSILFKKFAGIDSVPLCIDTKDTEEIIKFCKLVAPTFGGINLEDIKAPKCVEIERRLIKELDIPVFHDDQHGTAIITTAAIINSCKLANKNIEDLKVALLGTGAAGSSIAKMIKKAGVKTVYAFNSKGIVHKSKYDKYRFLVQELLDDNIIDSPSDLGDDSIAHMIEGTDVFIGVSSSNMVTKEMIESMNKDPFVFAMANPDPEIMPDLAKAGGAFVVGTGRSDFPNQANNVLAFPGIFKGALEAKATKINEEMKMAAALAIANIIKPEELRQDYVIPSAFDERVVKAVSEAVKAEAIKTGVIRK